MKAQFIYDLKTKNTSFLYTAWDLKRLGIKKHMFFLKLYNTRLVGVDPHAKNLRPDQIFDIINECIINPWYFLREVARIPMQGKPEGVPFMLNRANLAAIWSLLRGINAYLVIPRQCGKTESTIAILLWAFLFGMTNSEMMFLNFDESRAAANLEKLKIQRDLLPSYLRMKYAFNEETGKEETGLDNVRRITSPVNGNSIVVKGKAISPEAANKIGRGSTQPIQYIDEFEFINYIDVIMSASGPAFKSAAKNAKINKSLYGRIITSTPGDIDTQAGEASARYLEGTVDWTEQMFDWDRDRIDDYISKGSTNGTVYIEYNYKQIGKDDEWFADNCEAIGDKTTIKRDLLLQRIRGSGASPYDQEDLDQISSAQGKIIEELTLLKIYILQLYAKLDKSRIYFVGVDVSNGYNQDNSAVTIWDPYTKKTVAEFKSPLISVTDLIKFLYILMKRHTPNGILIIERNANGEAVLSTLRESDIAHRLYYDNTKDTFKDLDTVTADIFAAEARNRMAYGVYTQKKSRTIMFDLLSTYVVNYKDCFVGKNVIKDILNLVKGRSGKIEAAKGFHDDSIMSFLMCLYVYYYGNNLYRYGFVKNAIPDEENQNKGLYQYENSMSLLSEEEQALFGEYNKDFSENKDSILLADLLEGNRGSRDMKGMVNLEELDSLVSDGRRHTSLGEYKVSPEEAAMYAELVSNVRETEKFANLMSAKNKSTSFIDDSGGIYEQENHFFDFMSDFYK